MADGIRAIRDELGDLADYLRSRDIAPPVPPKKERPIGKASVASSDPLIASRGMAPIPLSPPPLRAQAPDSPGSISSGLSFLSSHHSDDYSLMESESYPPRSPPWDTVGPPSSASSGPSLSSGPQPQRASPAHSMASDVTARPREGPSLTELRDLINSIRNQTDGLWHGQQATNRMLDDLRDRRPAQPDNSELNEKLDRMEDLLNTVLEQSRARMGPTVDDRPSTFTSQSSSMDDIDRLLQQWRGRLPQEPAAPIPRGPGPNINEMVAELLATGPQIPPPGVQQPPPLVPLVHRPSVPRRADSPIEPPRRPRTEPLEGRRQRPTVYGDPFGQDEARLPDGSRRRSQEILLPQRRPSTRLPRPDRIFVSSHEI
jgi:hypothetical protein